MADTNNHRARVLIMGANEADSLALQEILGKGGFCCLKTLNNTARMTEVVLEFKPDLLLLDLGMPYRSRRQVMNQLRQQEAIPAIPVIALTKRSNYEEITRTYEEGALDYIQKPFLPVDVLKRVDRVLTDYIWITHPQNNHPPDLEEEVADEFSRLIKIVTGRNEETGLHIRRIGLCVYELALLKGFSPEDAKLLKYASMLHDIGKIAIPDSILLKPCGLTAEETARMQRHTVIGAQMLSGSHREMIRIAEMIALTHHERWDGTGYPRQLRGNEIPIGGQLTAICDVYDALLSKRPYKKGWKQSQAHKEILSLRGKAFDPELVDLFLANEQVFKRISMQRSIDDIFS